MIVEYEWRCLDRSVVESFCGKSQEARRLVPPMSHASYAHVLGTESTITSSGYPAIISMSSPGAEKEGGGLS